MRLNSITAHPTRHAEIDTARRYGNGTSETMLGELKCQERGLLISTKYLPALHSNPETAIPEGWSTSLLSSASATIEMLMRTHRLRPTLPSRYAPPNSPEVPRRAPNAQVARLLSWP